MTESPAEFSVPKSLAKCRPGIGLVLGSGLNTVAESLSVTDTIPYSEIEGLPQSAVPGHEGCFHIGKVDGVEIVIASGRVHLYEGWTAREVASHVRFMHQLGVETLILTNAAGIVNANFKPGSWMLVSDHINLARQSPLTGSPHFIDQTHVYSRDLRELFLSESTELDIPRLSQGVYAWVNGPEYETPAEVRLLRTLGADAVGMSTVPEAIQARALGMKIVALSCLTNYGAGLTGSTLSHEEVVETGKQAAGHLVTLLQSCIPAMVEI